MSSSSLPKLNRHFLTSVSSKLCLYTFNVKNIFQIGSKKKKAPNYKNIYYFLILMYYFLCQRKKEEVPGFSQHHSRMLEITQDSLDTRRDV